MGATSVVNIKEVPCNIYVGRGSEWGNPFKIGRDGTRREVIEKYMEYFVHDLQHKAKYSNILMLKGQTLGCHCDPLECHGHFLAWLVEGL